MSHPDTPLERSVQLERLTSDAYTLIVRQAPQQGKAFSGPKEKDRKPLDPPPIIQLRIRDPLDPAQNYLQSPYFFVCVNLQDADLNRPDQLAAAHQGEDPDKSTQSALAGTLVSSLHRLKDIDNTDGGFFVFPDISVKLEGQFRLRFSLFEMMKTSVAYIKSVVSEKFIVYNSRTFPGMSESTFLSRSFGDQGVKIRVRKEPRVLGKRAASEIITTEAQSQVRQSYNASLQLGHTTDDFDEPSAKRQRMVTGEVQRPSGRRERPYAPRGWHNFASRHGEPHTVASSVSSTADWTLGSQRTNSSSSSSSFVSPQAELSNYPFSTSGHIFQQPMRDQSYPYQPSGFGQSQINQSLPPYRPHLSSSVPSQIDQARYYPYGSFDSQLGARAYNAEYNTSRLDTSNQGTATDYNRYGLSTIPTTLPASSHLTLSSSHTYRDPQHGVSNIAVPSITSTLPSQRGGQQTEDSEERYGSSSNYQPSYQPP